MGVADALRALTDDELVALLQQRPDLAHPPATSFVELAARASTPHSLQVCVDGLDMLARQLLDALIYLHDTTGLPATTSQVIGLARRPSPRDAIERGLDTLRRLALVSAEGTEPGRVWSRLRPVRQVVPNPFVLGPPLGTELERHSAGDLGDLARRHGIVPLSPKARLVAALVAHLTDPDRLARVIADAPDQAQELLTAVHDQGSVVRVPTPLYDRTRVPAAIRYWLDHTVLLPVGWDIVQIPREIGLFLRGGHPFDRYQDAPPVLDVTSSPHPRWRRDTLHELAPAEVIDLVGRLLTAWGQDAPPALKTGGLGIRELRLAAKTLGAPERAAARLIELVGAAGLVVEEYVSGRITPTERADEWLTADPAARWRTLVDVWRTLPYELSRAGGRDAADKYIPPLVRTYGDTGAISRRAAVVGALTQVASAAASASPEGRGTGAGLRNAPDLDRVTAYVTWMAPSRWRMTDPAAGVVLELTEELALLGLTRGGHLTAAGRVVLLGGADGAGGADTSVVDAAFPALVTTFTVGADLTALAPAELDPRVRATLQTLADVESKGAASLYRFTDRSVRRGVDRGMSRADILAFLEEHARPAVPQPLRYLVDDVTRRYGAVRVGTATSYVRSDDPALLAEIVRSRKVGKAKLRLIAPTVAISPLAPGKVIDALREGGFLPAEEDETGAIVVAQHAPKRAPLRLYARTSDRAGADSQWISALRVAGVPLGPEFESGSGAGGGAGAGAGGGPGAGPAGRAGKRGAAAVASGPEYWRTLVRRWRAEG